MFAPERRREGGGAGFAVELDRVADEAQSVGAGVGRLARNAAERRVVPFEEHSPRPELGARQDLGDAAHPAHGDADFAQAVFPVLHRAGAEDRLQQRPQFLAAADAVGVRGELGAVEGRGHDRAELLPGRVVAHGDDHLAVRRGETLVRRQRRVGVAAARRFLAGEQVSLRLVTEGRHHRVEERHIHPAGAAVALPGEERRQDAVRGHHAGAEVRERGAHLRRFALRRTGETHPAAFALHDGVVTRSVGERAVLAVRGNGTPDEPRIPLRHFFGGKPQPRQRARAEVLDQHIAPCEQPRERFASALRLQVQRDAAFPPVHCEEVGAFAVREGRTPGARVVAGGWFDLEDLGAEVGEQHGGVRAGEDAREVGHAHPGERGAGRTGLHRAGAAAAASARSSSARASAASERVMFSGGERRTQFP